MLLLALATAVLLRFWLLGQWPPGLYRDEAFNGLDALRVLEGQHALFFAANNGREPAYIYLTAAAVGLFGQTAFAVRFAAAVVGALTTLPVYLLGRTWFGGRVGVLAAWVWAITLWPVHLSRIGLRVILLAPLLALTFWLGTLAYRRQKAWLWVLAGLVYGASFYTYLAARFTPVLLALLLVYLLATGRGRRLWFGLGWFALGTAVALLPFALLIWQQPELLLGRTGQVSILHPDVSSGDPLGTLLRQTLAAAGMYFWRGDVILRHNPAGRPVFDLLMVVPFGLGLLWCLRNWRRPAAVAVLLWTAVMLGPTILAADAPHFLRAAGVLPGVVFLPAIGLALIQRWTGWPRKLGGVVVAGLLLASLALTVRDYAAYSRETAVAYAFEAAAADLAADVNQQPAETAVLLDESFWSAWPSISFLVTAPERVIRYNPAGQVVAPAAPRTAVFAWPYASLNFVPQILPPPARIGVREGSLARGDLEETGYTLYVRYTSEGDPPPTAPLADFGPVRLQSAQTVPLDAQGVEVELCWQADTAVPSNLVAFAHVIGPDGLLGQTDAPLAQGRWMWWQTGYTVCETRAIGLETPFAPGSQRVEVGLYDVTTGDRLPLLNADGAPTGATAVTVD